jgi:glutathione synthetase
LRTGAYPPTPMLHEGALPENHSIASLAAGLGAAHKAYGSSKHAANLPLCVLFIVQDPERNIFDQRVLEYSLQSLSVPAFRLPFAEVLKYTKSTDHPSRALLYHPAHSPSTPYEVSVLYLRSTYTPTDFPDATSCTARLHLERSAAIKCPSILTHLAGSKKVQQVLATPDSPHLARFLKSPETVARIQNTFAAIYPLDGSPAGQEAKNLATDPEKCKGYVLKPQREGGGNNVYRSAIPGFLKSLGEESLWAGYVLMEIIEPPTLCNSLVREGEVKTGEVVGELGVYGTCLWRANGEILRNEEAGYLLRTKGSDSEEGGVAAGFGAVDSICLI